MANNIDLTDYEGFDKVVSSSELFKKLDQEQGRAFFVKSRFPTLNELIKGFNKGELITISGLTGNGKTLLMQTFTRDFSEVGVHSLWFTYEVPGLQFLRQFGKEIPHFYMPMKLADQSLKWIYNRILEAKQKFGVQVVFIDHLHYLADIMMSAHPSLEIGRVMRILKLWAVELEMIIFLSAHTKKIKPEDELGAGDTRDSSFVEQESDNVFFIWRSKNKETEAILKITKNRSVGIMNKKIKLMKVGRYLVEIANKKGAHQEEQKKTEKKDIVISKQQLTVPLLDEEERDEAL